MRALLLCILLALSPGLATCAGASELLILQSGRTPAYSEALKGFRSAFRGSEQTLLLSDYAEVDVQRFVREERPRLVLAVGDKALAATRKLRDVPVVSMLSLSLNLDRQWPENAGGVTMTVAPEQYLKLFRNLGAKRVGLLYDPKRTGHYVKRAAQEAREQGISLAVEPIHDPRDLQAKLEELKGTVDALWMLPDSTVITTVNLEALLLFSMAQGVPAVTFTSQYLNNGAAASLEIDPFDIGVQTGELAAAQLRNGTGRRVPVQDPRRVVLRVNESVLKKLRR